MFDTLTEACHYQATCGGRVYAINGTKKKYKHTALTEEMRQQVKEWDFEDGWVMFKDGSCEQLVPTDGVIHIQENGEIEET